MRTNNYLAAAARAVMRQLADNPLNVGVPVDDAVAHYMGASIEDAITVDDLASDGLFDVRPGGRVRYDGE